MNYDIKKLTYDFIGFAYWWECVVRGTTKLTLEYQDRITESFMISNAIHEQQVKQVKQLKNL